LQSWSGKSLPYPNTSQIEKALDAHLPRLEADRAALLANQKERKQLEDDVKVENRKIRATSASVASMCCRSTIGLWPHSRPSGANSGEIWEDRYPVRSMILTSQIPVSRWHEQIIDPTLADGILDRLIQNAHRIEVCGSTLLDHCGKSQDLRTHISK
jgi:hypothetical protein